MSKRAILYARVSTDDQADRGYSLPSQIELCRKYAERLGYSIAEELLEDYSGATPIAARPQGKRLTAMLKARQAEAIIAYQVDRLSRDNVELLIAVRMWLRAGIEVHTVDIGRIEDENNIILLIKGWQGSDERMKIRERTMRGKRAKAESGKVIGGRPPYGYRHVRDTNGDVVTLMIAEETGRIVLLIYRWYVHGDETGRPLSTDAIVKRLYMMGIPTPGELQRGYKRTRGTAVWCKGTILDILDNETYAGVWWYGAVIRGSHLKRPRAEQVAVMIPAIVTRELWEAAQARRKYNKAMAKRNAKRDYLLRGLIQCECSAGLSGNYKYNLRYYFCNESRSRRIGLKCRARVVRADAIEAEVWEAIEGLFTDLGKLERDLRLAQQAELDTQEPKRAELEAIEANILQTERNADEIAAALPKATGRVGESLQKHMDEVNALYVAQVSRRDELRSQLSTLQLTDDAIGDILTYARDVQEGIANADFDTKRRNLERLKVAVTVKDGHYKLSCLLGQTEGTVRRIPYARKGSVVTTSSWCNDRNDTARRIPGLVPLAPIASSAPSSIRSVLRS